MLRLLAFLALDQSLNYTLTELDLGTLAQHKDYLQIGNIFRRVSLVHGALQVAAQISSIRRLTARTKLDTPDW